MKLKIKFAIIIFLSSLVLASAVNLFYIYKTKEWLYDEFTNKSTLIAKNLSNLTKEALNNEDDISLFSYVDNIKKEENVIYSGVLNSKNSVIAHSDSNEIDKTYTIADEKEGVFFQNDNLKINNSIITNDGEKYLTICGFSTESLKYNLNNLYFQLFLVTIIVLFIPVIVSVLFMDKLQKNLSIIHESIQLANESIYNQEIKIKGKDMEILEITNSLINLYKNIPLNNSKSINKNTGNEEKNFSFETKIIENLINSIKDGILVINNKNYILLSNTIALEILNQDKLNGKHILEISKDNKELLTLFNESVKNKNETITSKIKFNGKEFDITIKTITKDIEIIGSIIIFQIPDHRH